MLQKAKVTVSTDTMRVHDVVLRVEGLKKRFELNKRGPGYETFREAIASAVAAPFRRYSELSGEQSAVRGNDFWALNGVDFEVRRSEAIGVIGRNGAGKSTLLKVLSRITEPTEGRVTIKGRIASLLEVGTGFHSELTGRENIFLNGAILGMKRQEIVRKFDEIVAFAEVEAFLDTPVKRYSSGMYMRLAFAVAACLEPDILIVDEVLAVGDLEFQKKCLTSMKGISASDRTVLFVSHNMAAVQALCDRCILLDKGRVVMIGPTRDVVQKYVEGYNASDRFVRDQAPTDHAAIIEAKISVDFSGAGRYAAQARLDLVFQAPQPTRLAIGLILKDQLAMPVGYASLGQFNPDELVDLRTGRNDVSLIFPIETLALGNYTLSIRNTIPGVVVVEVIDDCLSFSVERPPGVGATGALPQSWGFGAIELPAARVESLVAGSSGMQRRFENA